MSPSVEVTGLYALKVHWKPYPHQSTHHRGLKLTGSMLFVRFILWANLANVNRWN